MKKRIRYLLCERTDVLVLLWFIGGAYAFLEIAKKLDEENLDWWFAYPAALLLVFMYYYIAIKFNDWRDNYCKLQTMLDEADTYSLSNKSEQELLEFIAGYKPSTPQHLAGMQELNKRNSKGSIIRSNIALIIAGLSLLVAAIALFS